MFASKSFSYTSVSSPEPPIISIEMKDFNKFNDFQMRFFKKAGGGGGIHSSIIFKLFIREKINYFS